AFVREAVVDAQGREAAGRYKAPDREIEVSVRANDFQGVARHEVYHAAEKTIIGKDDAALVEKAFAPNSAGHKRVIEAVQKDKALDDETRRLIIEDMAAHPEEIRAYGFQYFWDGKLKSPKWLTRIWDTVKEF